MERIKVSNNFYLDEFIDPHTYINDLHHGLNLLDFRLIQIAQKVREFCGKPLFINTWWDFQDKSISEIENDTSIRKWSGLRTSRCNIGAKNSAHKLGKAIDLKGNQKELFGLVKENAKEFHAIGVRRLEDPNITIGWLHVDTLERNTKPNSIRVVDLTKCTQTIYF